MFFLVAKLVVLLIAELVVLLFLYFDRERFDASLRVLPTAPAIVSMCTKTSKRFTFVTDLYGLNGGLFARRLSSILAFPHSEFVACVCPPLCFEETQ